MPMVEIKSGNNIAEARLFNACLYVPNLHVAACVGSFWGIRAPGPNGYRFCVPLD
jgi:hypothetical protein